MEGGVSEKEKGESLSPGSLAVLPALLKTLSASDHPYRHVTPDLHLQPQLKQIRMSWALCFPSATGFKGGGLSRRRLLQIVSFRALPRHFLADYAYLPPCCADLVPDHLASSLYGPCAGPPS